MKAAEVHQYAKDVIAGKITACKWTRLACIRHLRDLERQGTDAFPYVFDDKLADRFFRFAGMCRHVEGELAGQPIELPEFWVFICGCVFGWVCDGTQIRRFRKMYVRIARKNAKSTVCGIISLYMLCADREASPQIYCAATKKDQAKIVYGFAKKMAENSRDIMKRVRALAQEIKHRTNGGFVRALSKDTKTMDGFNPHCTVIDEYHAHPTNEMYELHVSGVGMQIQPLLAIITTAGFSINSCCKSEDEYVEKILDGIIENEEYFGIIFALDSEAEVADEGAWVKANPLICTTPQGLKQLRSNYKEAKEMPEKWRNFLTKNMNLWLAIKADGYMDMDAWQACEVDEFPQDLEDCIVGVDLSVRIDLTSVGFIFLKDGLYYVYHHSFMPAERYAVAMAQDKAPYDLWAKEGWLTITDGAITDYDAITAYIQEMELANGWKPQSICYDPAYSHYWAQKMEDYYTMISVRQGMMTLAGPTADFRDQVVAGKVRHLKDPLLRWALANAVTRKDFKNNILLDKSKARERIDPAAALITGWQQVFVGALEESTCAYNERGLILV